MLALIFAAAATPADAKVHHHGHRKAVTHHTASRHHQGDRHASKASPRRTSHDSAKPIGVTSVPAGGLKLYCAAGRNPLLIRKSTQGAGTTVTVVCR